MGLELLDLVYRLERKFGVKVKPDQLSKMAMSNDPPDIRVGDLFDFIRSELSHSGVLDLDLDADALWPIYQCAISDSYGTNLEDVTKEKWLFHDLEAG